MILLPVFIAFTLLAALGAWSIRRCFDYAAAPSIGIDEVATVFMHAWGGAILNAPLALLLFARFAI